MSEQHHAWALGLVGALAISGCSENNSGGPAQLDSPEAAGTQAASIIGALDALNTISPGTSTAKAHEDGHCDEGSITPYSASAVDVNSPYTEQAFELSGADWMACRTNLPEQDGSSGHVTLSGRSAAGSVDEAGDDVRYGRVGADAMSPLQIDVHLENDSGGQSFSTDFDYTIGLLQHARLAESGDRHTELFSQFNGNVRISALDFNFGVRFGTSENERFRLSQTDAGETIDGSYSLSMDSIPGRDIANCTGDASVATRQALVRQDNGPGFSAGTLAFTSDGTTATVTFDGDQVTISAPSGEQTLSQSELFALDDDCSGLFLGGLAFTNL